MKSKTTFLFALTSPHIPTSTPLDLSGLKGVLLPPTPSFWPLPWGWWIVLGTAILMSGFFWQLFRYFYPTPLSYALRLLKDIQKKNLPAPQAGRELSKLLKRVALLCFERTQVANLTEKEWSRFIKTHGNKTLSEKEADFIAYASYMPPDKVIAFDEKKMYNSVRKWIYFVFKKERIWKSNSKTF